MKIKTIRFSAATAIGTRATNQDFFYVPHFLTEKNNAHEQVVPFTEITADALHVFAVCDGIASLRNSDEAAYEALLSVKESVAQQPQISFTDTEALEIWVHDTLLKAQNNMIKYCQNNNIDGSCTIVLLAIYEDNFVLANIGDSAAFLWKNEEVTELSYRHNVAQFKRMMGLEPSTEEEKLLLMHLGSDAVQQDIQFNVYCGTLEEGDTFLLCSDGVSANAAIDIKTVFEKETTAQELAHLASSQPNADNCTAIIINVCAS